MTAPQIEPHNGYRRFDLGGWRANDWLVYWPASRRGQAASCQSRDAHESSGALEQRPRAVLECRPRATLEMT
jgi:hypothetical protein